MKAFMLTGIREMKMMEIQKPVMKNPDDVLIKIKRVGICGSDVHYYTTGHIGSQVVQYPFTVGHEASGIVEQVSIDVSKIKSGDRIAIEPALSCGKCDQCLAGRPHTCRKLLFLGCPGQMAGFLSEYIIMPEKCCYKIPDRVSYEDAALTEPLSIGIYAVKQSMFKKNDVIGILGAGPIGQSVLLPALRKGISRVYVTDKIDERLNYAKKYGAFWTGNPEKINITKEILANEPDQLDIVFECCGKQEAVNEALDIVKPGGKLVLIGIPEFDAWLFNADKLRRKEINIINIRRQNDSMQAAIDMVSEKGINVNSWITQRFEFSDTKNAFDLVAGYRDGVLKAMIDFDR